MTLTRDQYYAMEFAGLDDLCANSYWNLIKMAELLEYVDDKQKLKYIYQIERSGRAYKRNQFNELYGYKGNKV